MFLVQTIPFSVYLRRSRRLALDIQICKPTRHWTVTANLDMFVLVLCFVNLRCILCISLYISLYIYITVSYYTLLYHIISLYNYVPFLSH